MAFEADGTRESAKRYGQLVARAWVDPGFKQRLLQAPHQVLTESGFAVPRDVVVCIVESRTAPDTDIVQYFVLPPAPTEDIRTESLSRLALVNDPVETMKRPDPEHETTRPPHETTHPPHETTRPPNETMPPPQETTRPPSETTQPPRETMRPGEETMRSPDETMRPAEETMRPAEETTRPAQETMRPAQETMRPAEETTRPAEETTRPAEETTAPPARARHRA